MQEPAKSEEELVSALEELFFNDLEIEDKMRAFAEANCSIFDEREECKLEYTEVYDRFVSLWETVIEELVSKAGFKDVEELVDVLLKLQLKDPEGQAAQFSRILTATADFDMFLLLMKETAAEAK